MSKNGASLILDTRYLMNELTNEGSTWSDTQLLYFLNRGSVRVGSILKQGGSESGMLSQTITTATSAFTVYNTTYTPSTQLALAQGATSLTLPPNCISVKELTSIDQTQLDTGLAFVLTRSDDPDFKRASRVRTGSANRYAYYCTFEGPTVLKIQPPLGFAVNCSLTYEAVPTTIELNEEVTAIPEYAYPTLTAAAAYYAFLSINSDHTPVFFSTFQDEQKTLLQLIASRNAQELEVVYGVFEDDYDGDYYM